MTTDEALAQGVQHGDKADLSELVNRHHALLIGYLYRMTGGDRALAEDLAQETFLRMMRAIQQYQYPRPFKPWLYALATNLARDHYKRAEIRLTETIDLTLSSRHLVSPEGADTILLIEDETRQVIAALAALPDLHREIVVLRYYQGLSQLEIAEALNIPVGTVKSRLSNGLTRLRVLLTEEEPSR
jgi:RNA polymerase sigma-70 factor (ECF subfamily)